MRKIILVAALLVSANYSFSQSSEFFRARCLDSLEIEGNITISLKVKELFAFYFPPGTKIDETLLNNNPFFKGIFLNESGASQGEALDGALKKSSGAVANLDVTKFANAISSLMIERAKQELTVAFFNRFKAFAAKHPEFDILFPKTTAVLRDLISYNYPQMLPSLRTAFFEDIGQVTFHLEALLVMPKYKALISNVPEIEFAVGTLRLLHDLENGTSPDQIIVSFSKLRAWKTSSLPSMMNIGSTLQFSAILSEGLRGRDSSDQIWVSGKDIRAMVSDPIFTRLFFGLIWERVRAADLRYKIKGKDLQLKELLGKQSDNVLLLQNQVANFISLGDRVQQSFSEIRNKKITSQKLTKEDYFNYITLSLDAIDFSFGVVRLFDDALLADDYLDIAKQTNGLYKAIYSEKYSVAVSKALGIIEGIEKLNPAEDGNAADSAGLKKNKKTFYDFARQVKPYAMFMANVADAKEEKDVQAALENVILPVGSSSVKKHTYANVSIQSYLGAYFSTYNASSYGQRSWSDRFGVSGPIGISYTPGFLSWGGSGALSLFASAFDLGAIIDYKLKKDPSVENSSDPAKPVNTTKEYTVNLGQILSPGVYAVYGFAWNLPLSFGFGAQYGPGLSKIDSDNNTTVLNPSWRWNVFLAVDMPFFNIVNKIRYK